MSTALDRAETFLLENARLLERRAFEHVFLGGSRQAVTAALRSYQNEDGGLGHALEADVRARESQPIHAEFGLDALREIGARDRDLAESVCEFLAKHADATGAVPGILPSALAAPRANHWTEASAEPSLERAIGLAGLLHAQDVTHPWLDRVTEAAWTRLAEPCREAHYLRHMLHFLEHVPDRARAEALFSPVAAQIFEAEYFLFEAPVTRYGLTPLHFAPTPDSPGRALFDDAVIDAHLDDLAARQQEDGGWPIYWEPPGAAALCEWRGRWTLDALCALHHYGRLG